MLQCNVHNIIHTYALLCCSRVLRIRSQRTHFAFPLTQLRLKHRVNDQSMDDLAVWFMTGDLDWSNWPRYNILSPCHPYQSQNVQCVLRHLTQQIINQCCCHVHMASVHLVLTSWLSKNYIITFFVLNADVSSHVIKYCLIALWLISYQVYIQRPCLTKKRCAIYVYMKIA